MTSLQRKSFQFSQYTGDIFISSWYAEVFPACLFIFAAHILKSHNTLFCYNAQEGIKTWKVQESASENEKIHECFIP